MEKINHKSKFSVCSGVDDAEVLNIKEQNLKLKMDRISEVIEKYGVRSIEFYNLIKPFIMKTLHRYIPYMLYSEDVVNEVYMKIIIAFEGGWQEKGREHKRVYKEAYFDSSKCKNIGNFIFTLGRNEATRFLTQQKKLNLHDDISGHIGCHDYTDDPESYRFNSFLDEPEELKYKFKKFKINKELREHLESISTSKPERNILRELMDWGRYE
jgi:hypothetical protein